MVAGVTDTAGHKIGDLIVELLSEFEAIFEKALTRVSQAKMELFDQKSRG
jgi:hypothetical protein